MATIVPAILEKTKHAFEEKVNLVCKIPGVKRIQVDFADGKFVPNVLLSASEIDTLNPAFIWEAHLMCFAPSDFLDYEICGFKTIIVHYEAYDTDEERIKALLDIKNLGLEPGLCLNLETDVKEVLKFKDICNHFQLMAITPGFQGTPFREEIFGRIKELRKLLPHAIIEIDGGVGFQNAKQLMEAGADLLIGGSSVVKAENPAEAFERLSQMVRG